MKHYTDSRYSLLYSSRYCCVYGCQDGRTPRAPSRCDLVGGEIARAITAIPSAATWDTTEVLRFGECHPVNELLIPVHMLGGSIREKGPGPLELETHCYSSLKNLQAAMKNKDLGQAPTVNFATFSPTAAKRGLELETRGGKPKVCELH